MIGIRWPDITSEELGRRNAFALVHHVIGRRRCQYKGQTGRRDVKYIADYAMLWYPLSQDGRRKGRPTSFIAER